MNRVFRSNAWLVVLLAMIIATMTALFIFFDQQSQWWFGTVVNDLYSPDRHSLPALSVGGNLAYLLAIGAGLAVLVGVFLLNQSGLPNSKQTDNEQDHNRQDPGDSNELHPISPTKEGLIEIVKLAVTCDDDFFEYLEDNVDYLGAFGTDIGAKVMQEALVRATRLQLIQMTSDAVLCEQGQAVDGGQWQLHKLAVFEHYQLDSSEAAAIALALDARYAVSTGVLAESDAMRLIQLLEKLGFSVWHEHLDNECHNGRLLVFPRLAALHLQPNQMVLGTVPSAIGSAKLVDVLRLPSLADSLAWLKRRYTAQALSRGDTSCDFVMD
ncbi:MAG: hypothetical protein MJK04_27710 [Psychrosphaera sp.]|nr:hypothetical protein [Psychrosphaera sp.]